LRLEQLYPFPFKALKELLSDTPKAEIVWCQEEPRNMGAWSFVREHVEHVMSDIGMKSHRLVYCGRKESASPATGSAARHRLEQDTLVQAALTINSQDVAAE
ncbi:MAG: 2-oxoglutarate dehydrogenase E1 component, partial [Candidatus Puniceispirillaceae bacterium]